jgi:glycosyltransferase involved in cell wall biosynthesis
VIAEPVPQSQAQPDARQPLAAGLAAKLRADEAPPGVWPHHRSVPVSVLVPVKNEESNLPETLRRLCWADQIVVVDSQSTDRTVEISQAFGAEVHQFHLTGAGWPKKKNWALENVNWRNEWILMIDADEWVLPELAIEIASLVQNPTADGYHVKRRFMFMGEWIRHCGYYPGWVLRLFRRNARYERIGQMGESGSGDNEIHEHVIVPSNNFGYLKHDLIHYAYPDLATWVEKHNRYSNWEAHVLLARDQGGVRPSLFGDPVARRRWLKSKSRWLPFRPLWRFLYSYVLQRGFLDGSAGFHFCCMLAWYEFLSVAKYREIKWRKKRKS